MGVRGWSDWQFGVERLKLLNLVELLVLFGSMSIQCGFQAHPSWNDIYVTTHGCDSQICVLRGMVAVDLDQLIQIMVRFSVLLLDLPEIKELCLVRWRLVRKDSVVDDSANETFASPSQSCGLFLQTSGFSSCNVV